MSSFDRVFSMSLCSYRIPLLIASYGNIEGRVDCTHGSNGRILSKTNFTPKKIPERRKRNPEAKYKLVTKVLSRPTKVKIEILIPHSAKKNTDPTTQISFQNHFIKAC